ncbi:cytochrome d ubiquinol oxidase subunit II [Rheinheimera baltica]|uniref:Cytochrome d ubiquinol oxidase subunit II n=1 Tax=Rheinheimera baltica TaxID=67576 RepID=A0ABT9HY02_9GAMM|nr:cytochrome d ubiquinol oxidase subunit II [Rheinheimera baltica]MDP5136018.1 cytochrome d ubiquinol oxidase subunit II [Rheinheimera baltica]MDP5142085.1 cytochrome d ubiquinol oxidase subunit II [Rheinheimera baltica]MDP5150542.1 cytochrome d ubiquinol oxidase subunit II [Rheinheimera baltica]MDP5190221.1 cytochrome d ubiquinol oxidase subunit II [Rheinheimera baltica]
MELQFGLPLFYFLLLGFAILMYVLLDGFDLGIGILYPWFNTDAEHDHLMRSISHVWDGNETWLVFGGVILFGAFPLAYASIASLFYLPIMLMLIGLIFRGVAFEYRFKSTTSKQWWNRAFAIGSSLAAFCQGLMLGVLVQGTDNNTLMMSSLQWLSPFSVFTGIAVMAGYALLACTYLTMKSRGAIQQKAARYGQRLLLFVMLAMLLVSLWTLWAQPEIRQRWFGGSYALGLFLLPLSAILTARLLFRDLGRVQRQFAAEADINARHESRPFWLAASLFLLAFTGLVVGLFPYLLPRHLTFYQAAAPDNSLSFMLPGIIIFVPLILAYTLWGYHIFRGKIEDYEEGY